MKRICGLAACLWLCGAGTLAASEGSLIPLSELAPVVQDTFTSRRPAPEKRLFRSKAVEKKIAEMKKRLRAVTPKLWWMFQNCFPNTLDTTTQYTWVDGDDDTFVITGDIEAMWLRDSAAQVWPYLPFMKDDEALRHLIRGVVRRQMACICIDPYANAFNRTATGGQWQSDNTDMKLELHERKYEIDSLCYPIRLAYAYWKLTGDASVFDERWLEAVEKILGVFHEQQRKAGKVTSYHFTRETAAMHDTMSNYGKGHPVKPVGMIASAFRPSDDCCLFPFLVPSNFFAVSVLHKAAEILTDVNKNAALAQQCADLANEVDAALQKYAVVLHPEFGPVYAFEVDGF
ncbi:MAG: glycoside hydrolase family 125 protein, partial [Bacteroidaceae bacterium]|nr:glycoside hydrolase family 125 protein [Bacteroidaceae bacterium]